MSDKITAAMTEGAEVKDALLANGLLPELPLEVAIDTLSKARVPGDSKRSTVDMQD